MWKIRTEAKEQTVGSKAILRPEWIVSLHRLWTIKLRSRWLPTCHIPRSNLASEQRQEKNMSQAGFVLSWIWTINELNGDDTWQHWRTNSSYGMWVTAGWDGDHVTLWLWWKAAALIWSETLHLVPSLLGMWQMWMRRSRRTREHVYFCADS